mmetsp:Transcript_201/g.183  ORF Transcript_201/g.183 Transcript_201/m.183 type:complete len:213 (+) Transcript_201:319-957(+)
MGSILFTSGATVTFRQLIEVITSSDFVVEAIIGNGITRMIVQYGNEIETGTNRHISEEFYKHCVEDQELMQRLQLDVVKPLQSDSTVVTYRSKKYRGFEMVVFPFSNDICQIISEVDLVISHAGTGSIIDTLRLEKPLIVVTNDRLMNKHQEEVADELVKLGCCKKITIEDMKLGQLKDCISEILSGSKVFNRLPECSRSKVEGIVYHELVR